MALILLTSTCQTIKAEGTIGIVGDDFSSPSSGKRQVRILSDGSIPVTNQGAAGSLSFPNGAIAATSTSTAVVPFPGFGIPVYSTGTQTNFPPAGVAVPVVTTAAVTTTLSSQTGGALNVVSANTVLGSGSATIGSMNLAAQTGALAVTSTFTSVGPLGGVGIPIYSTTSLLASQTGGALAFTSTSVVVTAALPAGSNTIGNVNLAAQTGAFATTSTNTTLGAQTGGALQVTSTSAAVVPFPGVGIPIYSTGTLTVFSPAGVAFPVVSTTTVTVALQPGTTIATQDEGDCRATTQTPVDAFLDNLSASATAYTVTNGKTLWVHTITLTAANSSSVTAGRVRIQDGASIKIPINIPAAGVGSLASVVPASVATLVYPQGKKFATAVNMTLVSGTITYSMEVNGCEE